MNIQSSFYTQAKTNKLQNKQGITQVISKNAEKIADNNYSGDIVSFSGKKSPVKKTLAILTCAAMMLCGCSNKPVNKTDKTSFSSIYADSEYSKYNKTAIKVGEKIFNYGENLTYENVEKEIDKFLKDNKIENIKIKDISESKEVPRGLIGAFIPSYGENIEFSGGTIYIGKPENMPDKNSRIKYAEEISHELTHVLQMSKDNTKGGMAGILTDTEDAAIIFKAIDAFKQTDAVNFVRNAAISDFVYNIPDENERKKIIDNVNKYGMTLYDKEININKSDIKNSMVFAVTGSNDYSFDDTVNFIADKYIDSFVQVADLPEEKTEKMKKALLAQMIYNYKSEAEAYRTGNAVEKAVFEINGDCLADMISQSYDAVAEVLEKKMLAEYRC